MEKCIYSSIKRQLKNPDVLIQIENIVTIYYKEFTKKYTFKGESHDFWELVYIDKGEVEVTANEVSHHLSDGDIIFHKPNEFHSIRGNGEVASNVLIISFFSSSKMMSFFEDKVMSLTEDERSLLGFFIKESKRVFVEDLGRIYEEESRLASPFIGAEQMMYIYLQQFLIRLIRLDITPSLEMKESKPSMLKKSFKDETINSIVVYLQKNMRHSILLDDICNEFFLSKTYLKKSFKKETGYTVMSYLRVLRMEEAKKLIRESNMSFTEISQDLGFETVHYFSTYFKKSEGLSPREYEKSIKIYEEAAY